MSVRYDMKLFSRWDWRLAATGLTYFYFRHSHSHRHYQVNPKFILKVCWSLLPIKTHGPFLVAVEIRIRNLSIIRTWTTKQMASNNKVYCTCGHMIITNPVNKRRLGGMLSVIEDINLVTVKRGRGGLPQCSPGKSLCAQRKSRSYA